MARVSSVAMARLAPARVPGPWCEAAPLGEADFTRLRRRAIFECDKWDPQVHDVCTLASAPLLVRRAAWNEVRALAEALAAETLAAEAELAARPALHARLGLPRPVRAALRDAARLGPARGAARLVRFDFHHTPDGWRISEANTDVPGGLNEAAGLPRLMQPHHPHAQPVGDPVAVLVAALLAAVPAGGSATPPVVALVHATAYSDDQQMLTCLARALRAAGAVPHLASPAHLRWRGGRAWLQADWWSGPLDLLLRFFPSEWLPGLPRSSGWRALFAGGETPACNPATALLTQSKRFPLVWDELRTSLPTWRRLLPETRDPREVKWRDDDAWVLKPALGRVGEGIGLSGVTEPRELQRIRRAARWRPGRWVAQRRFESTPLRQGGVDLHPCLGVYVIDGHVAGAYGRIARRPLIDGRAQDAAVLVVEEHLPGATAC
jgi:Glutathionylspermidine synthase preATP-grasp